LLKSSFKGGGAEGDGGCAVKAFRKVKELEAKVQRHKAHPSRLTPYSPEGES